MAKRKRVVGNLPEDKHEIGRFDVEELEDGEVIIEEENVDTSDVKSGIIVTYEEPTITFRSGHEVLKAGGRKQRIFSKEEHGKYYKKLADEFIESCKTSDGQRRPKYISHESV